MNGFFISRGFLLRCCGVDPPPPLKLESPCFSRRIAALVRLPKKFSVIGLPLRGLFLSIAVLGLAGQTALADDECGAAPASGGTIVCDAETYDPATDGNIVYRLGYPPPETNDYTIEFRDLKGGNGIVINDSVDDPHDYFPTRPNGVWIEHNGPGNLSALVSGVELTTTEADAGSANARGFNLTLSAHDADTSATRRDLALTVEKSTFSTYARAINGVHVGTGDVRVDVADTQITTTGPSGHAIGGWHDANGNVSVNAERVKIITADGYGVNGVVWNAKKFGRAPDPGDKTLSLKVRDSEIRTSTPRFAAYGLYARHQGSGKIDILLSNSSIVTEGVASYGIFTRNPVHSTNPEAADNLDIDINLVNSKVVTTAANVHGILIYRQENPDNTGANRITMDSTSQIETGDGGYGIFAQGESDITVGGRITAGSGGHGVYVSSTGTNTIGTGTNSRIEVEGGGAGIFVQGKSDITAGGRITVGGDGHGIHVDGTGGTDRSTIRTGANSRIEIEGAGAGIYAQGASDVTVEGRITASGDGHGIHVDGTGGTGTNMVRTGINSWIEIKGDGYGIKTQGRSIITIEGQIVAETKVAAHNTGGDLDVILRGNPRIDGQQVWNQNRDGHNLDVEAHGAKLVDNGEVIQRTAPTPESVFDLTVRKADGDPDFDIVEFGREFGPRAFIYESLPETLHTLNRLSTWQERGRATSQAEPFWMRAEGSRATRGPTDSTTGTDWQMERWVLQAGYGFLVGEGFEAGVSVHYGDSSTDISGRPDLGGGEIDTESYGLGASLTWRLQNGVYFDAQGAANWYDIDLSGTARGTLKSGVDGMGWALALESGRRLEMAQLTATPHVRVVYSEVDPDSFVDKFGGRVSSDSDDRTMGGLGVTFEGSQGWVLAEFQREFGTGTSVDVSGTSLSQRMSRTRVRIAMGGERSVLQDKLTLRGELGAASDISSSAEDTEVKARITAHMSF